MISQECSVHVHQVAENSVLFMAYGLCQRLVASFTNVSDISSLSTLQNATSGFCAAFFSSLVLCPTELIKCKLQAMHELNAGKSMAANRMYVNLSDLKYTNCPFF